MSKLSYKTMYKWVIAYQTMSGIRDKEWVNKLELTECFTKLFNSKNMREILDVNYPNLRFNGKRYEYDEKELTDSKVKK